MAGGAGVGAGLGIMGGTLGGIGDIIAATSYKRPKLPEPGDQEKRLRALVQNQMIGGGQQLLAGQNLYNQMTPFLLGQLPGMSLTQTGGGGTPGAIGGTTAGPMKSYQEALESYQAAVGRNQRLQQLDAQLKGMKAGPEKKTLRQERKTLRKAKKQGETPTQLERAMYQAGSMPPIISIGASGETPSTGLGAPSLQSSLAEIMGYLQGARGNTSAGGAVQGPASSFMRAQEWGQRNPRGDQDITPGFDASRWPGVIDPGMERTFQGQTRMELDPQQNVDRWLGILRSLPQPI